MMIGERNHPHPTVHVPPWPVSLGDDQTADVSLTLSPNNASFDDYSYCLQNDALTALQRFLPSNLQNNFPDLDIGDSEDDDGLGNWKDAFACDQFRMFDFKVRKCIRGRSHDWTECPFAHPGEKARRRDPRKYHYSGTACPDFRKGSCRKGDACEFAHGVFECWLHPARYRTQPCKDGLSCKRRVCFFAHTPEQLRVLSPRSDSYDGSPHRLAFEGSFSKALQFMSSPESGSPPSESPPMSPMTTSTSMSSFSRSLGSNSVNEMMASLHQLQLNKVQSMPSSWATLQAGGSGSGTPRMVINRPGYYSLPTTPTRTVARKGNRYFDNWDQGGCEEEPVMERVESGRDLRAKIFQKLSKENPLDWSNPTPTDVQNPDVGWVSDLVQ